MGRTQRETLVNTIDATTFSRPAGAVDARNRIAFIGTTHVDANRDGLRYFMRDIYPLVRQQVPDLEVDIVGGEPPADDPSLRRAPGRDRHGVRRRRPRLHGPATALIVPLRSGGGTRLKILEGLSFGVPTISSTIGAEGLDLVNGEHLLLADDPASFAAAVVRVLRDPELRERLSVAGRRVVEEHYDWRSQAPRFQELLQSAHAVQSAGRQA